MWILYKAKGNTNISTTKSYVSYKYIYVLQSKILFIGHDLRVIAGNGVTGGLAN